MICYYNNNNLKRKRSWHREKLFIWQFKCRAKVHDVLLWLSTRCVESQRMPVAGIRTNRLLFIYFVPHDSTQGDIFISCAKPTAGIRVTTVHTGNRLEITRLHTEVVYSQLRNRLTMLVMSHGKVRRPLNVGAK